MKAWNMFVNNNESTWNEKHLCRLFTSKKNINKAKAEKWKAYMHSWESINPLKLTPVKKKQIKRLSDLIMARNNEQIVSKKNRNAKASNKNVK